MASALSTPLPPPKQHDDDDDGNSHLSQQTHTMCAAAAATFNTTSMMQPTTISAANNNNNDDGTRPLQGIPKHAHREHTLNSICALIWCTYLNWRQAAVVVVPNLTLTF